MSAASAASASAASSSPRVLVIQSHVVSGYVGNKSSTFPLQVLGFDVDAINSVQFSNHTGYLSFAGQRLNGDQLWEVFEGLDRSGLLGQYTHLVTGYIGSASFLTTVIRVVRRLKEVNPKLIYVCDPVLGDNGKLYVPEELIPIYQSDVISLADVLSLNQYEAGLVTSSPTPATKQDALAALQTLHNRGIQTIVLHSTDLVATGHANDVVVIGSQRREDGTLDQFELYAPKLPMTFVGTGDLFTALLLAHTHALPAHLDQACEKVIATMQGVLRKTLEHFLTLLPAELKTADNLPVPEAQTSRAHSFHREMRLIQSKSIIECPTVVHKAQPLTHA
ncbi:pyridoxal kinase [Capsaspora owczarzaki ATCC 30864]|uniref:pyridoxal kinase n=1 Tax=Capsaspora owczarzaki (strain ATCC 30864) TaxID=595528 RepID=A0A0D2WPN1_CAPO3|nr:pyridoxal kinase [Capsaspora owczarzaki ATCC 30864]KJE92638.1 pyridoxal kinase [Capsaspora owczarzaki ATCC 30864]|eukprot:XP_004363288.1 pyridoxal kinase [Capsaspora owczarzaki ATCC 30864]